jgi:hypothetical protein
LAADPGGLRSRRAHPVARRHLKRAEALFRSGQVRQMYEELERAVLTFIGNRLNISDTGLTRQQLAAHLQSTGVSSDLLAELQQLLDECDRVRFSPALPDRASMNDALDRAGRLVVLLDERLNRQAVPAVEA